MSQVGQVIWGGCLQLRLIRKVEMGLVKFLCRGFTSVFWFTSYLLLLESLLNRISSLQKEYLIDQKFFSVKGQVVNMLSLRGKTQNRYCVDI